MVVISWVVEKLQSLLLWEYTSYSLLNEGRNNPITISNSLSDHVFCANTVNGHALKCCEKIKWEKIVFQKNYFDHGDKGGILFYTIQYLQVSQIMKTHSRVYI